jgi:hypothetical protein
MKYIDRQRREEKRKRGEVRRKKLTINGVHTEASETFKFVTICA